MARQTKSESKLTVAADKATALLQDLQSRLNREINTPVGAREEASEDLERQLQEYFHGETGKIPDQVRDRVIEAVADRILKNWESGERRELGALENQVIERVAARILKKMAAR